MEKTFTFDSKTKNAFFVHVLNMIIMAGKAVVITVFLTSIVFKVSGFTYLSLFFPRQDFLLAMFYFSLCIILISILFGILLSFGENKKEILKSYEKKDSWIFIKLF